MAINSSVGSRVWNKFKELSMKPTPQMTRKNSFNLGQFLSRKLRFNGNEIRQLNNKINSVKNDIDGIKQKIKSLEDREKEIKEKIAKLKLEKKLASPERKKALKEEIKALKKELFKIHLELVQQKKVLIVKVNELKVLEEELERKQQEREQIVSAQDIVRQGSYGHLDFTPGFVNGKEHSLHGATRDEMPIQVAAERKLAWNIKMEGKEIAQMTRVNSVHTKERWIDSVAEQAKIKSAKTRSSRFDGERGYHERGDMPGGR